MKSILFLIFILMSAGNFYAFDVLGTEQDRAWQLQPMPLDVYPNIPGSTNRARRGSAQNSVSTLCDAEAINLDTASSYVDTANHRLFVADTENNRIFVYELNSNNILADCSPDYVLGQLNFTTSTPGATQSTLNSPGGITYDAVNKQLFVADTNNNRIIVFDVSTINNGEGAVNVLGQLNFTTSTPGATQSTLNSPGGITYDAVNKQLFVADTNNNRIIVFDVSTINNGEGAVNVLGKDNRAVFFGAPGAGNKENVVNIVYGQEKKSSRAKIVLWAIIFVTATIAANVYFKKRKKVV